MLKKTAISLAFPVMAASVGVGAATRAAVSPSALALAAAGLAIGSMVGVATSDPGNRFTTGIAVAAAIPFVFSGRSGVDLAATLAAYGFGLAAAWLIHFAQGETYDKLLPLFARRLGGYVAYAVVYSALRIGPFTELTGGWEDLLPFFLGFAAWLIVEMTIRAALVIGPRELSPSFLARALLKDLNVFIGLALTGALFGELFEPLSWWALPIAVLLYAFAHSAFGRLQETKTTYKQTIRALGRIPEVCGHAVKGHSERTTELAVAIAKEMGLGPAKVEKVEFAGLMHDIGRVSLNEPVVIEMGYSNDDIARWSAEILSESPYLDKVAADVRRQYEPHRKPGDEEKDPDLSPVSRIVKVAAAYDWCVHKDRMSPLQSLEALHAESAYEYDPDVVESLRRLLKGRGILTPTRAASPGATGPGASGASPI